MYHLIFTIAITFFLNYSLCAQNNPEEEKAFKSKLEAMSSKHKTIQGNFTHIQKAKNIKEPKENKGTFYYDNEGLLALHYTKPQGDKIIMRSDAFIITNAGKTNHIDTKSNPMLAQISYMMQVCMFGDVSKLGRGWQMQIEKDNNDYDVVLTPLDRNILRYLTSMKMSFDGNNFTLKELRMEEKSGGYTLYRFSEKIINQKIDHSLFYVD